MPQSIKNLKHIHLSSEVDIVDAPKDSDKPRKFTGIGNSGKPFSYYSEMAIVDLENIKFKDKVPALLSHDRDQRVGFGVLSVNNHQLLIEGTLLNNEYGRAIAEDADAGFPWQMSAHISPTTIDELGKGDTAQINGQTITGPIIILKNCSVPEISFTPTGVDSETSAVVLSDDGTNAYTTKDTNMTTEELQKQVEALKAQLDEMTKKNEELLKQIEELEQAEKQATVEAQLSQAGFSKTEDGKGWQGLSAGTYNLLLSANADDAKAMINDLKLGQKTVPTPPGFLFSEQYVGDDAHGVQLSKNPLVAAAESRSN